MIQSRIDILKQLIEKSGLKKSVIAKRAGIDPNSLSRILAGTSKLNNIDTIEGLARAFNVSPGVFFGVFSLEEGMSLREVVSVPLIENIDHLIKITRGGFDEMDKKMIPAPKDFLERLPDKDRARYLKVDSDMFAPKIRSGDYVILADTLPRSGDLVLGVSLNTDQVILKRFIEKGDHISLVPEVRGDEEEITLPVSGASPFKLYPVLIIVVKP